jgi:hypothetical protein
MNTEYQVVLAKNAEANDLFKKLFGGFVTVIGISDTHVPVEGAFDDNDLLIAALNDLNQSKKYNVYLSLNELSRDNPPPVWKDKPNELVPVRKGESCTNANIARRRRVLIDIDRTEELKKLGPATILEKEKIYIRAQEVLAFLTQNGIFVAPYIVQADSGNGYHLLVSVDLPNDDASSSLVKRFLEALALKFNGDGVEIDTKVFDAKRITRAYGSLNRKGTPTKEVASFVDGKLLINKEARLHRRSRLFKPDPLFGKEGPVTAQQLEHVIAQIATMPNPVAAPSSAKGPATVEDVMAWAKHFGQEVTEEVPGKRWAIINPACAGRHGGKNPNTTSTRLFLTDGHLGFECHHSSCSMLTWPGYRTVVEAGRPFLFGWESEEAQIEEAAPVMPYPVDVWDGTLYGDFAKECTRGNHIPAEFFIESAKTVVGSIVGNQLYGDIQGMTAREYLVLIGWMSGGKGTAIRQTIGLFKCCFEDIEKMEVADLIWSAGSRPKWKQIGSVETNAGSEPGLYEAGMKCPRVLLNPAEFDSLLEKTGIQNSGGALLSQLRELFDSRFVVPSITKYRKMEDVPRIIDLSLITSTQPGTFEEAISRGIGTGFLSRLTLIRNDETRRVGHLPEVSLRPIKSALVEKIEKLEMSPCRVNLSLKALAVFDEWWSRIMEIDRTYADDQREITARLNILVLRNVLHLVWLLNEKTVTAETMKKACRLGDYQLSQRQALFSAPADNPLAMMQQKIVRALRQKGRLSRRSLSNAINARRAGTKVFDISIEGLKKEGIVIELNGTRANQKLYALRKEVSE